MVAAAVLGIAAFLVLAVVLVKGLLFGENEEETEAAAYQSITGVEVLEYTEDGKTEEDSAETEDKEEKNTGEYVTSENGSTENSANEEQENRQIAAEVAGMDDEEDPQKEESINIDGAGAVSDISAVMKGANETEEVSYGIDVAKWQGTIDWKQVADSGVEFAMIRIGYRTQKTGIIMEDPLAKYNMQQAKEAGLKLGVYFFSTAVTEEEAREEAAWVTGFIAQYPITYPVVYNCEGFQSPESRQYGMDNADRSSCAVAFLDYVQENGYTPMFYAAKNELEGNTLWDTDRLSAKYKIWVSQYPDVPYPDTAASSYSGTHQMWQYTSQGTVPGIGKGVDMNVAYFSYSESAEAVDNTPYEVVEADAEALLNMTEVNEQITAKIETNLRTEPSTASDDTIVGKLKNGEIATRTGISSGGWSRLDYNGQKVYAVSSYLTTDLSYVPTVFDTSVYTEVNEQVTPKIECNLRTEPGTEKEGTIVATIKNGDVVTRTGINPNTGWSRLDYNGQTVYAVSSYLTPTQ